MHIAGKLNIPAAFRWLIYDLIYCTHILAKLAVFNKKVYNFQKMNAFEYTRKLRHVATVSWVGSLIAPIIIWQLKKNEFPELDAHGKVVVNWIISVLI
jgi:hypothetical protein